MIRTVKIDIHAENPSFPLQPVEVFEHSAASFTILNVPRAHGKREIGGVTVIVTDVDGVARGVAAVRNGSAWNVTIPETSIGRSGSVANGVMIAANGLDERGAVVPMWILGVGDLTVMRADGSVAPGEVRDTVHFFETAPANPSRGDIAPIEGVLKIFNGEGWMDIGGAKVTLDDEVSEKSENGVKSSGIWKWVKNLVSKLNEAINGKAPKASVGGLLLYKHDGRTESYLGYGSVFGTCPVVSYYNDTEKKNYMVWFPNKAAEEYGDKVLALISDIATHNAGGLTADGLKALFESHGLQVAIDNRIEARPHLEIKDGGIFVVVPETSNT